jgi:hypothetical protein
MPRMHACMHARSSAFGLRGPTRTRWGGVGGLQAVRVRMQLAGCPTCMHPTTGGGPAPARSAQANVPGGAGVGQGGSSTSFRCTVGRVGAGVSVCCRPGWGPWRCRTAPSPPPPPLPPSPSQRGSGGPPTPPLSPSELGGPPGDLGRFGWEWVRWRALSSLATVVCAPSQAGHQCVRCRLPRFGLGRGGGGGGGRRPAMDAHSTPTPPTPPHPTKPISGSGGSCNPAWSPAPLLGGGGSSALWATAAPCPHVRGAPCGQGRPGGLCP